MTTLEDAQGPPLRFFTWRTGAYSRANHIVAAFAGFFALLLFYSLATFVLFRSEFAHLHSALIGPPEDNLNDFWDTWYVLVAHDPAHFFRTALLRFPEGTPLLYQSFAWPQLFAVFVLSRFFGTEIHTLTALQNLTILASFPLAGTGAFYLVRHFVRSTAGALIGGFVFAFNPSHVAHALHHAGVSSIEFLPFFVLAYLLALERRSNGWLAAAVAFYALSALSCWYYLFYCGYFMGFQLLYQRVREGAWPRGWALVAPMRCAIWTALLLSPLILPMIFASSSAVYDGGGNVFVADLLSYVTFPPEHLLAALGQNLSHRFTGLPWEATVYLGLVNLAALAWVCARTGMARSSLCFYVVSGMVFFVVLASGEALHIAGTVTFVHLPDVILDRLPFLANVRAPSRIIVFVYLFLSIGVGFAVVTALRGQQQFARVWVTVIAILIALDFYPAHRAATPVTCSKGLAVLERDPDHGFGVFNLPISYAAEDSYMLDQICDHRPLIDGMIARETGATLIDRLSLTNLARQRAQLREGHVKYVVIHRPQNGPYVWNAFLPPISAFLRTYREIYSDPELMILRVY